jgi:hypothetical protein
MYMNFSRAQQAEDVTETFIPKKTSSAIESGHCEHHKYLQQFTFESSLQLMGSTLMEQLSSNLILLQSSGKSPIARVTTHNSYQPLIDAYHQQKE